MGLKEFARRIFIGEDAEFIGSGGVKHKGKVIGKRTGVGFGEIDTPTRTNLPDYIDIDGIQVHPNRVEKSESE